MKLLRPICELLFGVSLIVGFIAMATAVKLANPESALVDLWGVIHVSAAGVFGSSIVSSALSEIKALRSPTTGPISIDVAPTSRPAQRKRTAVVRQRARKAASIR